MDWAGASCEPGHPDSPTSGSKFTEQPSRDGYLDPERRDAEDEFGYSVAIDGTTAVVGAPGHDGIGNTITDAGAAYVFVFSSGSWEEQARLLDSDPDSDARFGASVAIEGDRVVVGAPGDAVLIDGETVTSGSASVFQRSASLWTIDSKLTPSDGVNGDEFGASVSIDVDRDDILVGAPDKTDLSAGTFKGAAYQYDLNGTEVQKFVGPDSKSGDRFGESVSTEGDGFMMGAPKNDELGSNAGAAYLTDEKGPIWAKHTASDGASGDQLGISVEFDFGPNFRVAGAWFDEHSGVTTAGSAYVFNGTGEVAKLTADNPRQGALFGASVATEDSFFVAGAPADSQGGVEAGAIHVFNSTFDQVAKRTASDAADFRDFGSSVSTDGDRILVGSPGAGKKSNQPGSAYVFK